jgi:hypothetical protein
MADDDDSTDDASTNTSEWTPPSKEDYEKLAGDLARTRAEAKDYRLKLKAAREAANGTSNSTPVSSGGGQPAIDLEAERRKWQQESDAKTERRIIGERARTALAAAGLVIPEGQNADQVIGRAVRMLDLDSCSLSDSGSVSGLDAELDALRAQYPGMFKSQRRSSVDSGTAGRSGSRDRETTGAKPSSANRLASRWQNGGRD